MYAYTHCYTCIRSYHTFNQYRKSFSFSRNLGFVFVYWQHHYNTLESYAYHNLIFVAFGMHKWLKIDLYCLKSVVYVWKIIYIVDQKTLLPNCNWFHWLNSSIYCKVLFACCFEISKIYNNEFLSYHVIKRYSGR